MSLAQYLSSGSDRDWVTLNDCYVDDDVGKYCYPLKTSHEDRQPVKLFLHGSEIPHRSGSPRILGWPETDHWISGGDGRPETTHALVFVPRRNESEEDFNTRFRQADDRFRRFLEVPRQQVSGMISKPKSEDGDIETILKNRGAVSNPLILKLNVEPPSEGEVKSNTLICIVSGVLFVVFGLLCGWLLPDSEGE